MATRNVLVLGLGPFGGRLASELTSMGYEVLGVDPDEKRVAELSDTVSKVVHGDATSAALWRDLPVKDMDIAIVAFSENMAAAIQAVVLLKNAGVSKIVAKSESDIHTEVLHSLGVTAVLEPFKDSVARAVHIMDANILDYLPVRRDFGVAIIKTTPSLKGLTIQKLYEKYKTAALILVRGDRIVEQPSDHETIADGDILVVAARDRDLHDLPGVDVGDDKNSKTPG